MLSPQLFNLPSVLYKVNLHCSSVIFDHHCDLFVGLLDFTNKVIGKYKKPSQLNLISFRELQISNEYFIVPVIKFHTLHGT